MGNDIDKLAGVGQKITIKGKEYILSPLTVSDYGEMSAYAKATRLKIFSMENPSLTVKQKIEILSEHPNEAEINGCLSDISGLIFQVWLHLRHHQALTLCEVSELIDHKNFKAIRDTIEIFENESKNA